MNYFTISAYAEPVEVLRLCVSMIYPRFWSSLLSLSSSKTAYASLSYIRLNTFIQLHNHYHVSRKASRFCRATPRAHNEALCKPSAIEFAQNSRDAAKGIQESKESITESLAVECTDEEDYASIFVSDEIQELMVGIEGHWEVRV